MFFAHISYAASAHLRFKEDELRVMLECAKGHYDFKCKSAGLEPQEGEPHPRGLIPKLQRFHKNTDGPFPLPWGDIDTLCKIMEAAQYLRDEDDQKLGFGLMLQLRRTLHKLNDYAQADVAIRKNP